MFAYEILTFLTSFHKKFGAFDYFLVSKTLRGIDYTSPEITIRHIFRKSDLAVMECCQILLESIVGRLYPRKDLVFVVKEVEYTIYVDPYLFNLLGRNVLLGDTFIFSPSASYYPKGCPLPLVG